MMGLFCPDTVVAQSDPFFGSDKMLHGGISLGLGLGGYAVSAAVTDSPSDRLILGGTLGLLPGFGKELLDHLDYGRASGKDIFWNIVGVSTGVFLGWLVDHLFLRQGDDLQVINRHKRGNGPARQIIAPSVKGETARPTLQRGLDIYQIYLPLGGFRIQDRPDPRR